MMIQINGVYPLLHKVYFLENMHISAVSDSDTSCPISQYKRKESWQGIVSRQ
jgi:hypothetical protein